MKAQLLSKTLMFFILLIFSIIFFSILFIILSTLNIRINIEIVYKPKLLPTISEYIYFSLFSVENINEKTFEKIEEIIPNFKIIIDERVYGKKEFKSGNVYENYLIRNGKILKIRILT